MTTESSVKATDVDKAAAMMLEHLGHTAAAGEVLAAMEATLAKPETRTGDLGGTASTAEVTETLVARLG